MNNNAANAAATAVAANANINYEEYDYNSINTSGVGDDLLNNRINNVLGTNNNPTSTISAINPSNNFLLYYYVEYM